MTKRVKQVPIWHRGLGQFCSVYWKIRAFGFGKAIALSKGVTNKKQAQREVVDSPFGSLQPVTLPEPSQFL
jgi:hypothetical protein